METLQILLCILHYLQVHVTFICDPISILFFPFYVHNKHIFYTLVYVGITIKLHQGVFFIHNADLTHAICNNLIQLHILSTILFIKYFIGIWFFCIILSN